MSHASIGHTRFGFTYGPATVERLCDDERSGVYIAIIGKRNTLEIRVTPGGRVTVYSDTKRKPMEAPHE